MKLSDYVINYIEERNIEHIFGLPGGGCIHLMDSIKKSNIKFIGALHEQGASIMAEAYAQYKNDTSVLLTTTGPGATNAITGITSAWLDSVPMVVLTGQVQLKDKNSNQYLRQRGFQEINIVKMVKNITKMALTIREPEQIKYYLDKAFYLTRNKRPGPVLLDIPLDIQATEINVESLIGFTGESTLDSYHNYREQNVREVVMDKRYQGIIDFINASQKPILLIGNGVRLSGAEDEFINFAVSNNIPVLTTWKAADLIKENHYLFVGRPGSIAKRGANLNQQNCDLMICVGARLDSGQIAYNWDNFAPNAQKIRVDIDIEELNKYQNNINDIPLVCEAKYFFQRLNESKELIVDHIEWAKQCKDLYNKLPLSEPVYTFNADLDTGLSQYINPEYVDIYHLIKVISENTNKNHIIVPGSSGACSEVTMQALEINEGVRVFNSPGLGAMGFGIPASIGGAIASGKKTICIDGDGGFIMNIQELELVTRYKLPIIFFVLNNNGYGSIRTTQNNHFNKELIGCDNTSGLTLPSIGAIAHAFKIKYFKAYNNKELSEIKMINNDIPIIVEVMVDPEQLTLPRVQAHVDDDGKFYPGTMENMYPYE